MLNYYLYRINTGYDGFMPSKIPERRSGNRIVYNWDAYVESLDRGDIVLTYFFGGCKRGVYAITRISRIDVTKKGRNVFGTIIDCSVHNDQPLIADSDCPKLFSSLLATRKRGAEILVPPSEERKLYELLLTRPSLLDRCKKHGALLPGSPEVPACDVTEIPRVNLAGELDGHLQDKPFVPAFWIRPRQGSWMSCPTWLLQISSAFSGFKSGDMTYVELFADALEEQVRQKFDGERKNFAFVTSVPLCAAKQKAGEVDRVAVLATAVAQRIGAPYRKAFRLTGRVSRRLYKNMGYGSGKFRADYLKNLSVSAAYFREAAGAGKPVLLVDDVYTDGVTTEVLREKCSEIPGCGDVSVAVATLGIMAKKYNMSGAMLRRLT